MYWDDGVAHELSTVTKTITVQMKEGIFGGKNTAAIITFLHDFRAACDDCSIHTEAAVRLLNDFLTELVESAIKAQMMFLTKMSKA